MRVLTRPKRRRPVDEDTGPDLISRLPDDVLGDVVTLLPAADGAPHAGPLPAVAPAVARGAAQPRGRCRRGRADHPRQPPGRALPPLLPHLDGFSAVDDVLWQPGLDGLQEFELRYSPSAIDTDSRLNPAPLSVFRFSPTLRVLTVHCRGRRLKVPAACPALDLPRLEQLTLKGVVISESTLHAILSRCLVLQWNVGYRHLRISSPTLRSLGIWVSKRRDGLMLEQVTIEDAPLLERLFTDGFSSGHQQIRVIQAPKLKILGYLENGVSEPT
ncbi:hypothetical protein C2845_PM13G03170 [Panicum miliaceum]|uniref:F-box/LRR-repeat protein 15/At3g58940/PEG3-like LRR domain-containing protein n=1 Tax=Panicum miliaceum TaxID=4540 RepID=A0A3L6RI07_PANMI|nr:hypothetical protein C2845_PM13G03170 [Panicum miliaceum]